MLRDGLSFLIKRLFLIRSSVVELDDGVDNIVKSLEGNRVFGLTVVWEDGVGGGLTSFFPSRAEIPKWSEIRV